MRCVSHVPFPRAPWSCIVDSAQPRSLDGRTSVAVLTPDRHAEEEAADANESPKATNVRGRLPIAAVVFAVLLGIYASSPAPLPTWDAYANVFPALSLLNDGDLELAPTEIPFLFAWSMPGRRLQIPVWERMIIDGTPADALHRDGKLRMDGSPYYFVVRAPGGEWIGSEPPGAALAAAPLFKLLTLPDTAASLRNVVPLVAQSKLVAAFFTAVTAAIVFLIAARWLGTARGLLVAAIFGLGTCAWSLGSQALWAQTAMQPFVALGIDQFFRLRDGRRGFAVTTGLALGCAVCVRSTSLFVLVAIGAYLLATDRKALALCIAGALPPLAVLAAYNARHFGSPFVEAHMTMGTAVAVAKTGSPDLWSTPLWQGALGLLVSPARGLLVYSPILVLSFVGAYHALRDAGWRPFAPLVVAAAVVMAMRFKWFDWWGGFSYGYRPLMDAIVPLTLLTIPALGARRFDGRAARAFVAVALAWSIAVQWIGTAYDSQSWDRHGGTDTRVNRNVDDPKFRDRLWSLTDTPILWYLVHRDEALAIRNAALYRFMKPPVEMRRATE